MAGPSRHVSTRFTTIVALVVLLALVTAWSVPIATRMIGTGDYPDHLRTGAAVAARPHLPAPHFLYFASVAAVLKLAPGLPLRLAGIATTTFFVLATAIAIFFYLRRTGHHTSDAAIVWLTLALLMVGPVLLPAVTPDVFLIGFFVPNPYHNATIITARPFAVALLGCAAAAVAWGGFRARPWAAAALVGLSAAAKPNYLLCLVPAVAIVAAVRAGLRHPVRWGMVASIVVPAGVLVLLMREAYGARGMEVIVAPFAALRYHTAIDSTLALKFVASVAFPLTVLLLWPRLIAAHGELVLAWLAMIIAVLQAYLLAEAGPRIDHVNLAAGASLAVFVLMVASCGALLARPPTSRRSDIARLGIATVVFALHVWGGYRHLFVTMTTPQRWFGPLGYVAVAMAAIWIVAIARERLTNSQAEQERTQLRTR